MLWKNALQQNALKQSYSECVKSGNHKRHSINSEENPSKCYILFAVSIGEICKFQLCVRIIVHYIRVKLRKMFNCVINSTLTASFYKYKEKCIPSISSFFTTIDIPKYFVPLASNCLKLKKKKLFDCNLCRQIACNWFNVLDVLFGEVLFIKVQSNFS